jgi:hypothetical protein
MNYCLNCGETLGSPQPDFQPTEQKTSSFVETPTVVRNQPFVTSTIQNDVRPRAASGGSGKLLMVLGGVAVLIFLLVAGVAAIIGYNYFAKPTQTVSNTGNGNSQNSNRSTANSNSSPSANSAPAASFTPPVEPTKKGTFTVYANGGWQISNIDTVPLENFRTSIDGKVDISGVKTGITAKGVSDATSKARRIYSEYPTGALLMRTRYADGKFSNVMAVAASGSTSSWQNYPDERGRIEFCINDNAPESNGGQFTVTVTFTNIAKPKK